MRLLLTESWYRPGAEATAEYATSVCASAAQLAPNSVRAWRQFFALLPHRSIKYEHPTGNFVIEQQLPLENATPDWRSEWHQVREFACAFKVAALPGDRTGHFLITAVQYKDK